ncbi:uncharacterized protein LOC111688378 isoform X1 [Lucilia cuprina]|uniref:uncharacterized protein LOC111688378 isoform X1 n=2 Tax=Lucilia cuprina TaxID=7375 RepID=UPI001F067C48|nr:uncharacterized protein LOC111688378 isoform X1 [Lucilia cuprina]XP_046808083.1 uncharacterized protein LOC111688378 isoform X1 [Lucilia cuprina]
MDELITPELDRVTYQTDDFKMEIDPIETKNENWNPLTEGVDIGETLLNILDEVRSLRERYRKSDEEKQQLIKTLRSEIKQIKNELGGLDANIDPEPKLLPKLPINTLEDLKNFDEKLPLDSDLKTEFIKFLKRFSGHNFIVFLRAGLRAIVTDELAINLTWRGTQEKPSIQCFTTFVLLREICLSKYPEANHTEINRICQQHFLHARDRVGRKNKGNGSPKTSTTPTFSGSSRKVRPITPVNLDPVSSSPLADTNLLDSDSAPPSPETILFNPLPMQPSKTEVSLPKLPFKTLQSLEEFDDQLLDNKKLEKLLKQYINKISGRDHAKFIRGAYKAILIDEVATKLSWRGTKEKQSIQEFNIFLVIRDLCYARYPKITNSDINKVCHQHFLHAKDRLKKRANVSI